jgi:hypothetical protein
MLGFGLARLKAEAKAARNRVRVAVIPAQLSLVPELVQLPPCYHGLKAEAESASDGIGVVMVSGNLSVVADG